MTFLKYARVSRRAPLYMLCWQLGFFLFGLIMVLVINAFFNDETNYACMGSLMASIATLVGVLARGNSTVSSRFSMAVSMGQTRRSFLLWDTVLTALTAALGLLVSWCLYLLEDLLYGALYPGFENDMPFDGLYRWQVLLPIAAGLCVFSLVMGAVHQRFGVKGFGVLWIIFCFSFMLVPQALNQSLEGGTSLIARFGGALLWAISLLSPVMWACLGAAVLLALLAFSVLSFCRAEVRG